jgi:hypothetical protein
VLTNRWSDPERSLYSRVAYFSTSTVRFLKFRRVFMILIGVFLLILFAVTAFTTTKRGSDYPVSLPILSFFGSVFAFWFNDFDQGQVVITPTGIRTRNRVQRSARRDDIDSLDVFHSGIGEPRGTTPVVFLKNGKSFILEPLLWTENVEAEQPRWTYDQQLKIVHEIRTVLSVGGRD